MIGRVIEDPAAHYQDPLRKHAMKPAHLDCGHAIRHADFTQDLMHVVFDRLIGKIKFTSDFFVG